ncbi:MAG: L,D-transpeptidase [Alistipes sp.]|nr:L,D-transpeptidase [Alistipes sp.]MBQ5879076.1 L,D-transpeptidase [Alistipes sp.]MBR0330663.1 L,D-transpeptidase [Alistipes sp.]
MEREVVREVPVEREVIREVARYRLAGEVEISKRDMTLTVRDTTGRVQLTLPIACGKNRGQKQEEGDMRTPEGRFYIQEINDSHLWKHDFGDGLGEIEGAYGGYFIRLFTPPHRGIGIHGTHLPSSIGERATEGCIRLKNEDLKELVRYIYVGMPVVILPDE